MAAGMINSISRLNCDNANQPKSPHDYTSVFWGIVIAVAYAGITYLLAYHIAQSPISSDYEGHTLFVSQYWIQGDFGTFFKHLPYPVWHIVYFFAVYLGMSHFTAIGATTAFFNALSAWVVYYICIREIGAQRILLVVVATVSLLFVTAIWIPLFNPQIYTGQGSPTIWHNPTYIAVRPFALFATYIFCKCLEKQDMSFREVVVVAVLLVFGAFCKPSFIQVFLPSALIFLAIAACHRTWHFIGKVILALLPTCCVFVFEFFTLFPAATVGNTDSGLTFSFFGAWMTTSPNVFISALLLLAFPIFMIVADRNEVFTWNARLGFPAILLSVGFAQNSFLAEMGERFYYGNFGWGFFITVFIFWVLALPRFFRQAFVERKYGKWTVVSGMILLLAHFVSGICYCFVLATTNAPY